MKLGSRDITKINCIAWLLASIVLASESLSASAQWSKQVELYHWVDFPIEAPGAADGIDKWDVEGSCVRTHESGAVRRTSRLWYSGSKDTYVCRFGGSLQGRGSNYVQVLGAAGLVWRSDFRRQGPQNAAVGCLRAGSDEIFIWCRSRYNQHQKPFVFDSKGQVVFDYAMDNVAPPGWTASGVEVIHTIDWTGQRQQLACAKERHTSGDVCFFEPLTGRFV